MVEVFKHTHISIIGVLTLTLVFKILLELFLFFKFINKCNI